MAHLTDGAELFEYSFCGKSQKQVRELIGSSGAYICDECTELCNEIIGEELGAQQSSSSATPSPKPHEVNKLLSTWVIGQDRAKRALSVAVYNRYKRMRSREIGNTEDMLGTKSNILLLGPIDTGKIRLARYLARLLDVPFAIMDTTTLTEAGYVGGDVENALLHLIQKADSDIKKAEKDTIYADEIDKIGRKAEDASITRDMLDEGVQQALLEVIESTVASVPPTDEREHSHQQFLEIGTSGTLSIAAGALANIENIMRARLGRRSTGFGSGLKNASEMDDLYETVSAEDLYKFGMIPEFIGRLPTPTSIKELTEEDLVRVLTEPSNSLVYQYQHLFELGNMDPGFAHETLLAIAAHANKRETGARGLSSITGQTLSDLMSDLPSRDDIARVVVTRSLVESVRPAELYPEPSSGGERNA